MAHRALMSLQKELPKLIKPKPFENLLIVDFEATCKKGELIQPQEIIEFPCLALSTSNYEVIDVFHEYVKPRFHPQLTTFCTELTGILQETVDREDEFPQVYQKFLKWLEDGKYFSDKNKSAFVTCGDWDLKVMLPAQCSLYNMQRADFFNEWINLKTVFYHSTLRYPRSLPEMLRVMQLKFVGQEHCGIDDCHNIVRIITSLAKRNRSHFKITSSIDQKLQFE